MITWQEKAAIGNMVTAYKSGQMHPVMCSDEFSAEFTGYNCLAQFNKLVDPVFGTTDVTAYEYNMVITWTVVFKCSTLTLEVLHHFTE